MLDEINNYAGRHEVAIVRMNKDISILEKRVDELEYKNSVLWRWCLANSILLILFVVLMLTY